MCLQTRFIDFCIVSLTKGVIYKPGPPKLGENPLNFDDSLYFDDDDN